MAPAPGAGCEATEGRAAAADQVVDELECALCADTLLEPTTLQCCGQTFCKLCLRRWLQNRVVQTGVPRCPAAGCDQKLPYRLPATNQALQKVLELLAAPELERRKAELAESAAEEPAIPGGFVLWQEVVASATLMCNTEALVRKFTPGILVCATESQGRVTVKFERREDGSELCVNVLPTEICAQLPRATNFRMGDAVAASKALVVGDRIVVAHGVRGVIEGVEEAAMGTRGCSRCSQLNVRFEQRCDGNAGMLSVLPFELVAPGPYAGGFVVAQRVAASRDLVADTTLLVRQGTAGTVWGPYNDLRIMVRFDERHDGQLASMLLNVTAGEIRSLVE